MDSDYIIVGEKSFWKRVLIIFSALVFVAAILTVFITYWYATDSVGSYFRGPELIKTAAIFALICFLFCGIYAYVYFFDNRLLRPKFLAVVYIILIITIIVCCVVSDLINVFIMPLSLASVLMCLLLGSKIATVGNIVISQMILLIILIKQPFAANAMSSFVASVFCNTIGGFVLLYFVSRHYTRVKFIVFSAMTGALMAPVATAVSLALGLDEGQIMSNTLWIMGSNLLTVVLFMPLLPLLESVFNIMTDFKLEELCNLSRPMLKKLAEVAPGTFNHSMLVGQMAESCALAIGEDVRLARAAAYYHDVGKMTAPEYFAENLKEGINPHDDLIPEVSVSMITRHAKDGAKMIIGNRMPEEIAKVALEHHGTTLVRAFYAKAQKITEGELKNDKFRYEGPKPSTKIAAIIMICDASEAMVRAISAKNRDEFPKLVDGLVADRLNDGQFDNCNITMNDLFKIKKTVVEVLGGIHHARVDYK